MLIPGSNTLKADTRTKPEQQKGSEKGLESASAGADEASW